MNGGTVGDRPERWDGYFQAEEEATDDEKLELIGSPFPGMDPYRKHLTSGRIFTIGWLVS